MDNDLIKEIMTIVSMLDHLQISMQAFEDKGQYVPLSYTYLYELGIWHLLEIFDASPEFLDILKTTTTKALKYLLEMYKEQGNLDPLDKKLKKLNDAIQKAKEEQGLTNDIPDTVGKFLEKYTQEGCIKTPSMKDPMDKLLDEYIASKKRAEERDKKNKKKNKNGKTKRDK